MLKLNNYPCWELMWKHVSKKGGNRNTITPSLFLSLGRYIHGHKRQHKHLLAAVRKEKLKPLYLLVQMALSNASWRRTGNIKGILRLRWNPTEEFYSAHSFGKATHFMPVPLYWNPHISFACTSDAAPNCLSGDLTSTLPRLTATLHHKSSQRSYSARWGF